MPATPARRIHWNSVLSIFVLTANPASAAPSVTTSAATGLSAHSATLRGTVQSDGQPAVAFFEYGTTAAYGSTIPVVLPAGPPAAPQEVSSAVSGLFSGTDWHFRLTVISDGVPVRGADMTFSTLPSPGALTATFSDPADVAVTSSGFNAAGKLLGPVTLNFTPAPGSSLMLVKNNARNFISGTFSNLAQGQYVDLTRDGITYRFVANYCGGTGNDLVLQWAGLEPICWGRIMFDPREFNLPFIAVAAAESHTMAIKSDGTVVEWGLRRPGTPANLTGIAAIEAGMYHSLALKRDGTLIAWGENDRGQATVPPGISGIVSMAGGERHSAVALNNGTVVCWGFNDYGQSTVPPGLTGVKAVDAGRSHTVALKHDGTVLAWGNNRYGAVPAPAGLNGVMAIAAGDFHTLALKSDGTVTGWGHNDYGATDVPPGLSGVVAIAAGYSNSAALKSDGTVVAWGYRDPNPGPPPGLTGVVAISAKGDKIIALKRDGTITAWGRPHYCETITPADLTGALTIAAGDGHGASVRSDGSLLIWGSQSTITQDRPVLGPVAAVSAHRFHTFVLQTSGQLASWGTGNVGPNSLLGAPEDFVAISAGYHHNLAVRQNGTVMGWGLSWLGEAEPPASVTDVHAVAAGDNHGIALKSDGTVTGWGNNFYGQIPQGLSNITAVAAGTYHTLTLHGGGTVTGWGYNFYGQAAIPPGIAGVKAVAAGDYHSVALRSDGTIAAWGLNDLGQSSVPANITGAAAISASPNQTMALIPLAPFLGFDRADPAGPAAVTIRGSVVPNGQVTSVRIEYGKVPEFGSTATAVLPSPGSLTAQDYSVRLTGLTPGTDWQYRVIAESASGVASGVVGTFTTPAHPLQAWRQSHFGPEGASGTGDAADDADPDQDRLTNLAEWGLGRNPRAADGSPTGAILDGTNFVLTYSRSSAALAAGAIIAAEASATPALAGSWTSAGLSETLVSDDGVTRQIRVTAPATAARLFLRIKVRLPD